MNPAARVPTPCPTPRAILTALAPESPPRVLPPRAILTVLVPESPLCAMPPRPFLQPWHPLGSELLKVWQHLFTIVISQRLLGTDPPGFLL